MFEESNILVAS